MTQGSETVAVPVPRLDLYLAGVLPQLSRSQLQKLIYTGHVQVNGAPARAAARLKTGDRVSWEVPAPRPTQLEPETMELAIVHEDEDLVVIDKPAGMVVHPGPGHSRGTLVHGLLGRGPNWSSVGGAERPGIVHRLDRDTSGLLVVARNDTAHQELSRQLQQRTMRRRYRAIVVGEVAEPAARIEAAIGRDPHHRQRMAVLATGKEAVTEFRRLEIRAGHSLLDVGLQTGRTHQVRVHLAYIQHPVLGDSVYGRRSPLIARPALHAAEVAFRHPRTGRMVSWRSPLPPDMVAAWDALAARTIR